MQLDNRSNKSTNYSTITSPKSYSVLSELGQGSFGSVYLVQDEKGKKFALKRIQADPFNVQESLKQIQVMKKLSHHNLFKIYDFTFENENQSIEIIMQYCEQGDLLNYFKKKNKIIPTRQLLKIFKQIVQAFIAMNIKGVFHRDLKPQNILLSKGLIAKIADFGCARLINGIEMSTIDNFTLDKGTAIYAAPQLLMNQKYSAKCDVWSAGVILYFMHFKHHPFMYNNVQYTLKTIKQLTQNKTIELPPNTDPTISKLIQLTMVFKDKQRSSWRQLWLSRLFMQKINNIKSYVEYLQQLMKISNAMTKIFWVARKSFQITQKKDQVFIFFFIKFQYTLMLQAQAITQKSKEFEYLFTPQTWQQFIPDNNFTNQIQLSCGDREKFFQSIKKSLQSKQIYKKIQQKQTERVSAFSDLDQSIKYGYKILHQVYEQLIVKKFNKSQQIDFKVWVFLGKWINFQRWFVYEKQPRLQRLIVQNVKDPIKFIKQELQRYEQGSVV